MQIELKNVMVHNDMSEETTCFSASVYIEGERRGMATNDGQGGITVVYWDEKQYRDMVREYCESISPKRYEATEFMVAFEVEMKEDILIDQLLADWQENQYFKRHCNSKTLFRLEGDEPDQYHQINRPYDESLKGQLQWQYGDRMAEIINERFLLGAGNVSICN